MNAIEDNYYANSFFGTYDHYQRIGWYFDKIVENISDLTDCLQVMTGRFVLVTSEDAVFIRTNEETEYISTIDQAQSTTIEGFRFIGYLTPHAKLLLDENGEYIDIDASNFIIPYKIANDDIVKRISAYYFPTSNNISIFGPTEELIQEEESE